MTEQNQLPQSLHPRSLATRVLQAAGLGLMLVTVFLLILSNGRIGTDIFVPMLTVFIGGAGYGIFFYLMDHLRYQSSRKKIAANIICALFYIPVLFFSMVYGLSLVGLWN